MRPHSIYTTQMRPFAQPLSFGLYTILPHPLLYPLSMWVPLPSAPYDGGVELPMSCFAFIETWKLQLGFTLIIILTFSQHMFHQ